MQLLTTIFRWLAVPIAAAGILAACALLSSWLVTLADQRCVSMVAGSCVESWHSDAVEWATYLGIVMALLTIPMVTAWIAPKLKTATAVVFGLLASSTLLWGYLATRWNDLLPPLLLGLGAALVSIYLVWRHQNAPVKRELSNA